MNLKNISQFIEARRKARCMKELEAAFARLNDELDAAFEGRNISSIPPQHCYNQLTSSATEMAVWATEGVAFNDFCNRASVFGYFVAHYDDYEEAKIAVANFAEEICSMEGISRWVRRDIVGYASCHFYPNDSNDVLDAIAQQCDNDEEICQTAESYLAATVEDRANMKVPDYVPRLINRFEHDKKYFESKQSYLQELREILYSIEDKYGI